LRGPNRVRRGGALQDLAIIEDGSVLIRDGVIAQVGSTRRIENLKESRGAAEIAVNGAIVMPGFVDPAIHLTPPSSQPRGKRRSSAEFYDHTLSFLRSCVQHGTLNAQVKISARNQDLLSSVPLFRQLSHIGDQLVGTVRTWRIYDQSIPLATLGDEFAHALAVLVKRKLVQRVEVASESGGLVPEKVWAAARANGVAVNLLWSGGSPETLAYLLQRAQPRSISCACALTPAERALLIECPVPVIFSPAESILSEGYNDTVEQLAEQGAGVTLSSGYDERQMPVFNMQTVISLAVLRLRLTVEQAICGATINAAHASGLGHVVGSLEAGKRADLLVINLSDYREIPRRFGVNHVGMAIRDGKIAFNRTGWKVSAA